MPECGQGFLCSVAAARAGAAVAPGDAGSSECERGTEGIEEEAMVPAVEHGEGRAGEAAVVEALRVHG